MLGSEFSVGTDNAFSIRQLPGGRSNVPQSRSRIPLDRFGYQMTTGDHSQSPHSLHYDQLGDLGSQPSHLGTSQPMVQHSSSYRQPNTNQDHQTLPQQWGYRPPGSQMAGDPNQELVDSGSFYKERDYGNIDWDRYDTDNERP